MMKKLRRWLATMTLTASVACGWSQETAFPYPTIPDDITEGATRMAWLMENFWMHYDFDDLSEANQKTGEQGFVDYLYFFQHIATDTLLSTRCAGIFTDSITKTLERREFFTSLMSHYLEEPDSPLRDDRVYAHLLNALPQTPHNTFLLKQIRKNQVGTVASDFSMADREGHLQRLSDVKAQWTLIVFNDPWCSACQKSMPAIIASKVLQRPREELTVLSVYPDSNTAAWLQQQRALSNNWTDCYSPQGDITLQQTYYLPSLPALYLLDANKTVVLKNTDLKAVEAYLQQNGNPTLQP